MNERDFGFAPIPMPSAVIGRIVRATVGGAVIGIFHETIGEEYVDKGQQHYEEQQRQRSIASLKRRAALFGFQISPLATTA